ncbi:AAA family ATPase [Crocosphaera sp. UHCC 0190]|uniref:AAA family ATPase n=1 Tax=Crocosphaera sp. UHCC 0190 TaxID=3110246 RepID=UPI002B20BD56|nr:AAA family ATPase [Crocosphaera sp. UHCC 0190]MEA5509864.1 AAA family ATPase [Crocosphaera sp. UHCC 0190]
MYLKEILLENVASIDFLDVTLPFNDDGTPQPVIIVGVNGSGKSILLSYIADALIEFAKTAYTDIVPGQSVTDSPYFKICGVINQKIGSEFSIGLLEFISNKETYCYLDKSGNIDPSLYIEKRKNRFEKIELWDIHGNQKIINPQNKQVFETCFDKNVFCYFPPNRNECPHWLNRQGINQSPSFKLDLKHSGVLNKPIYIESSIEDNKSWILDVFLDSMIDIPTYQLLIARDFQSSSNLIKNASEKILNDKNLLTQSRLNIEKILQSIFQDNSLKLAVNYRQISPYRLCLTKQDKIFIPSLDNLSSGQSILFNLFATIIRYADKGDINKSIQLDQIEGIVIIDEIDVHLHSDLQYEILPKLIKLFPKVQFIVTTHSPLFILGMENEYQGKDFKVIEMPQGQEITIERFSEFKTSFDYYKKTKAFEYEVKSIIEQYSPSNVNSESNLLQASIWTEGKTDIKHLKAAFRWLQKQGNVYPFELDFKDDLPSEKQCSSQLLEVCKQYCKKKEHIPIIAIFDRDEQKITKQVHDDSNGFKNWGNGVYSFALPIPNHRANIQEICIEHYYQDLEIKRKDKDNRRLFLSNEFHKESGKHLDDINLNTTEINKFKSEQIKIIDDKVFDSENNNVALSKDDFATYIYNNEEGFNDFEFSAFREVFEIIEKILKNNK